MSVTQLPRGLALNGLHLVCPGLHQLGRLPLPKDPAAKRASEQSLGRRLFVVGDAAYLCGDLDDDAIPFVELDCDFDRQLHLHDIREAFASHGAALGLTMSFGFAGEIKVLGIPEDREIDGIIVRRRLRIRITEEGYPTVHTWLWVRHDTRWLVAGSLARALPFSAAGERAERISGDGPRGGEIVRVDGEKVQLMTRDGMLELPAEDYTVVARSSYVARNHGDKTFRALQVASGTLTASGHRNRYAVKDRFAAAAEAMSHFGSSFPLGRGQVEIEQAWAEIRIQGRST